VSVSQAEKCNSPGLSGNAGLIGRNMQHSKLKWQCRRGMRELDELLLSYLDRRYPAANEAEKAAFQSLLTLPDPEIASYLLKQHTHPPELTSVIQKLLDRSDT